MKKIAVVGFFHNNTEIWNPFLCEEGSDNVNPKEKYGITFENLFLNGEQFFKSHEQFQNTFEKFYDYFDGEATEDFIKLTFAQN